MDSVNGGNKAHSNPLLPKQLTPQSMALFAEGISLVLSRWTTLQMAIQNEWGGRDSRQKSDQLTSDILSWFSRTKELYIDDLEDMLYESMTLFFNVVLEDGSEIEIAEKFMIMHEECLQENYESIQKLRVSDNGAQAVAQSRRLVNENDDESSDEEEEEASDMVVDEQQKPMSNSIVESTSVDKQNQPGQSDDGWCVVSSRRNKVNRPK